MKIIIYKSLRILQCLQGDDIIREFGIQLGFGCADGPKLREGDGRTPEGKYTVSSRNPQSKYHLSLGISYPNPDDARRGLEEGILDTETYDALSASPHRPSWDTPMGGFVMIHGQPASGPREGDWTAGCIALTNEDMDFLFANSSIGDEVIILP